jgi:alpha-1,3-glucan synthase
VLERYPIFWCLKSIGSLPNPDPTDTAEWRGSIQPAEAEIDREREVQRCLDRRAAQEWAGLEVDALVSSLDPKTRLVYY